MDSWCGIGRGTRGLFSGMLRGVSSPREGLKILTFLFRSRLIAANLALRVFCEVLHNLYAEKSFKGYCVGLEFNVWCIHSKHRESACRQAHPCALARRANPS